MKLSLFLIVPSLLQMTSATLLAGNYIQLSCTGTDQNPCFENASNPKCRAIKEMIEAKIYMQYEEGYGQVPETRRLQEDIEQEDGVKNLRSGNRELQTGFSICSSCTSETQFICQAFCCPGYCRDGMNRALVEEEPKVCTEEITLDEYLVDFPTKPIEKCFEGVTCVMEYLC